MPERQTKKNTIVCPKAEGFVTMAYGVEVRKSESLQMFQLPSLLDK